MFDASIYQSRSEYQKLADNFRPNFNVNKHLQIADEYFNQGIRSYNILARKHECSPTRIKKILEAFQEKILPVINSIKEEDSR